MELTDAKPNAHIAAVTYEATDVVFVFIRLSGFQRHVKYVEQ